MGLTKTCLCVYAGGGGDKVSIDQLPLVLHKGGFVSRGGGGGLNGQVAMSALGSGCACPTAFIAHLVRQAVSQTVSRASRQAETHSLGFFSGRSGFTRWGGQVLSEQATVEWVMQPTADG